MALIDNILSKMINLHEDFRLRGFNMRSIWMFYKCYNIAINILGIDDKTENSKNRLWRLLVSAEVNPDNKKIKRLEAEFYNLINSDLIIVTDALITIQEENDKLGINKSHLWRKGILGFPAWEIEERE